MRSALLVALVVGLFAASAQAADAPKGKPRAINLEGITVEGHIQKPQAFYILPRSNLNYSALETRENLLPKIRKATEKEPF